MKQSLVRLFGVALTLALTVDKPAFSAETGRQQAPQAGSAASDDQVRHQIQDLVKTLLATDDLTARERIAEQILALDPAQPLAVQQLADIQMRQKEQAERDRITREAEQTRQQQARTKQAAVDAARASLAASLTGGGSGSLQAAQSQVAAALAAAPGDPEVILLKQRIDAALAAQHFNQMIAWAAAGGVLLAAASVVWFRLRPGVRELWVVEGADKGARFPLDKEQMVIGALAGDVDIAIQDASHRVSRHHCEILRSGRHYFITDRSANGTIINGRPAAQGQPVLLRRGDRIGLASEVTLLFR